MSHFLSLITLPGCRVETDYRGMAGAKLRESFYDNMDLSKLIELCSKRNVLLCANYTSIKSLITSHNIVPKRKQSLFHEGAGAECSGLAYKKVDIEASGI